jgi:hypothetical protein
MKTFNQLMITIAVAAAAIPTMATAQTRVEQVGCSGVPLQMTAVAITEPRSGDMYNFSGSQGQLDPTPLLETTFTVGPSLQRTTCVTVTFSAQINPSDNYGVYQASIDNAPMIGHATLTDILPYTTPVVFDATNQGSLLPGSSTPNVANSHMVSYTFFAMVTPGTHVMRIKMATCCSPDVVHGIGGVTVRSATAVVRW